jgi:hypothetical protein
MIASDPAQVAGRVFNGKQVPSFCAVVANLDQSVLRTFFANLFELEVAASRLL